MNRLHIEIDVDPQDRATAVLPGLESDVHRFTSGIDKTGDRDVRCSHCQAVLLTILEGLFTRPVTLKCRVCLRLKTWRPDDSSGEPERRKV